MPAASAASAAAAGAGTRLTWPRSKRMIGRSPSGVAGLSLSSQNGHSLLVSLPLPIDLVLPDLLAALRDGTRALLVAPPGAGKTTRVAPALFREPWCEAQVLLLVPRRLAARSAAEYMAREIGEQPGETIGYQTRLDSRTGKKTRVIVMTHGVFLSRIQ